MHKLSKRWVGKTPISSLVFYEKFGSKSTDSINRKKMVKKAIFVIFFLLTPAESEPTYFVKI